MSKVIVRSTICGFKHIIEGKKKGDVVVIDIDSDCEKIKEMAPLEVTMMDVFDIKDNIVMDKAKELKCSSNCLVPCGIMHVSRIELGLLLESVCKKHGNVSIEFE